MAISDAERARRSAQAKRQHALGQLGSRAVARKAAQRSAEVRSSRSSEIAQEILRRHAQRVEKALVSGLSSSNAATRVKAAETIVRMALSGQRAESSEIQQVAQQHTREELLDILSRKLSSGPTAQLVRERLAEPIVDGEAVEVE